MNISKNMNNMNKLINNMDVVYVISFMIILMCAYKVHINTTLPKYTKTVPFNLVFLLCIVVILHHNLIIGTMLSILYLTINQ